ASRGGTSASCRCTRSSAGGCSCRSPTTTRGRRRCSARCCCWPATTRSRTRRAWSSCAERRGTSCQLVRLETNELAACSTGREEIRCKQRKQRSGDVHARPQRRRLGRDQGLRQQALRPEEHRRGLLLHLPRL